MIRINLLPVREARRQATLRRQALVLAAAAGVGVLICLGMHFSVKSAISSGRTDLRAKKQELKKLEATRKEVQRFEKERNEIEAKLSVIAEIEKARTGPVRVMDAIASEIPKRVWLTSLAAKEGSLALEGRSLDAEIVAEFLTKLEGTSIVSDLELQETQLKEIEGLKLNTFKFKGRYPHPKPPAAVKGKKKKRGRKRAAKK